MIKMSIRFGRHLYGKRVVSFSRVSQKHKARRTRPAWTHWRRASSGTFEFPGWARFQEIEHCQFLNFLVKFELNPGKNQLG